MKTSPFFVSLVAGLAAGHFSHGPSDSHTLPPILKPTSTLARSPPASLTTQGNEVFATHMVVRLDNGTSFTMNDTTEVVDQTKYVNDPLNKWRLYNFHPNAAVPTGSCDAEHDRHDRRSMSGNVSVSSSIVPTSSDILHQRQRQHHCQVELCMWNNFFKNATGSKPHFPKGQAVGCHNLETCHRWCQTTGQNGHNSPNSPNLSCSYCVDDDYDWTWIALMILATLAFLGLLLLALTAILAALRRRRKQKREDQANQPGQGVAPQQTGQTPVVVQQISEGGNPSQATSGGGAGNDAGGAGGEKSEKVVGGGGDDGKGTTGKRAEEGRGQVQFEDGGHPGSESHVETKEAKPAGQMDGAVSGWEVPGMGSMRGRKLQRGMSPWD